MQLDSLRIKIQLESRCWIHINILPILSFIIKIVLLIPLLFLLLLLRLLLYLDPPRKSFIVASEAGCGVFVIVVLVLVLLECVPDVIIVRYIVLKLRLQNRLLLTQRFFLSCKLYSLCWSSPEKFHQTIVIHLLAMMHLFSYWLLGSNWLICAIAVAEYLVLFHTY